jgi:hypothetical protein
MNWTSKIPNIECWKTECWIQTWMGQCQKMFNSILCMLSYEYTLYIILITIDRNICWHSNHRLQFIVCQPRKTNFHFPLVPFPYTYIYTHIHTSAYIYILPFLTENRKQKPRCFALIHLWFAHCTTRNLSFIHLLMKKQMEVICLQTN